MDRARDLQAIKTPAGFAVVAGVELALLDCVRYTQIPALAEAPRREPTWKLELNETIELDA